MKVSEVKKMLRANDCYFYREGSRHEILSLIHISEPTRPY